MRWGRQIMLSCNICKQELAFSLPIYCLEDHHFYIALSCPNEICDNFGTVQYKDYGELFAEAKAGMEFEEADESTPN